MLNHGDRARAEAELRRGARRSDAIIAAATRCVPQRIGRWRRELADPARFRRPSPAAHLAHPHLESTTSWSAGQR